MKNGQEIFLLYRHKECKDNTEMECLRVMFSQGVRTRDQVSVASIRGILKAVKSEDVDGQSGEDTPSEVQKIKREDLPNIISKICNKFEQASPRTYLRRSLPHRWAMNSKLL